MQPSEPVERVSVYRPPEYTTNTFQSEVVESALNVFRMKVDATSVDEQRMSFSARSPGLGLVCSSRVFLECDFKIRSNKTMSLLSLGPQEQQYKQPGAYPAQGAGAALAIAVGHADYMVRSICKPAFGQGDPFSQCLSSTQLVVNGASLSENRQNEYQFALDQAWFSSDVMKKRFSAAGGPYTQYDTGAD